jgi:hypothetical protein
MYDKCRKEMGSKLCDQAAGDLPVRYGSEQLTLSAAAVAAMKRLPKGRDPRVELSA